MSGSFEAAGFVLAGGRSSRMGSEKALIELAGEPLVAHAVRILRQAGLTVAIAGARSPLEGFAPVVPDSEPDRGPLGGICSALDFTAVTHAVFLSVDMPLLPSCLVALLLEEARVGRAAITVPLTDGYAQTFPVVVERAALPWLRTALEAGRGGCYLAFQAAAAGMRQTLKVLNVEQAVKDGRLTAAGALPVPDWFLNVNEPADVARADECLAGRRT